MELYHDDENSIITAIHKKGFSGPDFYVDYVGEAYEKIISLFDLPIDINK